MWRTAVKSKRYFDTLHCEYRENINLKLMLPVNTKDFIPKVRLGGYSRTNVQHISSIMDDVTNIHNSHSSTKLFSSALV